MTREMGRLVILVGLPGAGKTTIATWLSREHGFVVASRDVIRAAMFPACRFSLAEKAAAYAAMKAAISTMLALGMPVVTDGICFSSAAQLSEVAGLAKQAGVDAAILHCAAPVALAQERVEHDRKTDPEVPADRDAALVAAVAAKFDPIPASALQVDTSSSIAEVRARVADLLGLSS